MLSYMLRYHRIDIGEMLEMLHSALLYLELLWPGSRGSAGGRFIS